MAGNVNLLALETTSSQASIALFAKNTWFIQEEKTLKRHTEVILPIVEALLKQAGIGLSELDGIVFSEGPGGFTGLRVACSVAKGLAYADDLPLYPVSSLETIIFTASEKDMPVLALLDARMKELYWAFGDADTKADIEAFVSPPQSVTLPPSVEECIIAGLGYEAYFSDLPTAIQKACVKKVVVRPSADNMIKLVLSKGMKPVSVHEAMPKYIRNQVVGGVGG